MIRVVLGLMPQALRSRPASGAQKRLTSNVGRTQHQPGQNITSCSVRDRMNHSAGGDYGSLSDLAYDVVGVIVRPVFEMANTVVPPSGAPVAPLTPPGGRLTTVSLPPVGNVCVPIKFRSTESLAAL